VPRLDYTQLAPTTTTENQQGAATALKITTAKKVAGGNVKYK
jgi:hypothetical protein